MPEQAPEQEVIMAKIYGNSHVDIFQTAIDNTDAGKSLEVQKSIRPRKFSLNDKGKNQINANLPVLMRPKLVFFLHGCESLCSLPL